MRQRRIREFPTLRIEEMHQSVEEELSTAVSRLLADSKITIGRVLDTFTL
jgi:hypothetical protein